MSLPYFPMFPTDFDADTGHLSFAEDGAYNRLLRLSWKCPGAKMPDDMDWIHRRARAVSVEEKALVASVIAEFFTRSGGKIFSKRLVQEWSRSSLAHSKRVTAGAAGGRAKALNAKQKESSNATAMLYQPEPEPDIEKGEAKASQKKKIGTRLDADWFLPKDWGEWALSEGVDRDFIKSEADKFRDYWHSKAGKDAVKLDWQATWRNWIRTAKDRKHGNGNHNVRQLPQSGKRVDPALAQIARLTGIDGTQGNAGAGIGSPFEEGGSLWVGQRPQ